MHRGLHSVVSVGNHECLFKYRFTTTSAVTKIFAMQELKHPLLLPPSSSPSPPTSPSLPPCIPPPSHPAYFLPSIPLLLLPLPLPLLPPPPPSLPHPFIFSPSPTHKAFPSADSVYRQRGPSTPSGVESHQREWFVFDHQLVLPEYIIDFQYSSQVMQNWLNSLVLIGAL